MRCRRVVALILVAGSLGAGVGGTSPGELQEIDLRQDRASEGGYVWFCYGEGEPFWGFVAVTAAGGTEPERAFGMWSGEDTPVLGALDAPRVGELRGEEHRLLAVRVNEPQLATVRAHLKEWSGKKGLDRTETLFLDFTDRVVRDLDLKPPYRSALSGPDPRGYFDDLRRLNRPRD